MTDEHFFRREIYFIEGCQNKVALDIGAHTGEFTDMLARKHKICYAFEPAEENVKRFQSQEPNVRLVQKAVSNQNGRSKLYIHNTNPGGHTLNPALVQLLWADNTASVEVETVTIDTFCADMDVGVIKCDVESTENVLFESALETLQRCNVTLFLEVHMAVELKKLTKLFTSIGYTKFVHETGQVHEGIQRIDAHYMINRP